MLIAVGIRASVRVAWSGIGVKVRVSYMVRDSVTAAIFPFHCA